MLLGRKEIISLWKTKKLRFEPDIDESQIGICSIDLKVGNYITRWKDVKGITVTPSLSNSDLFFEDTNYKDGDCIAFLPKEFILTHTREKIFLPNNIAAMVEGRSTYARWGLSAHVTAPLIEPGFYGPITLEMYNHGIHGLNLVAGKDKVCQVILHRVSSAIPEKAIANLGRYRGQTTTHPKPYDNGSKKT